jgi:hypothetical protein
MGRVTLVESKSVCTYWLLVCWSSPNARLFCIPAYTRAKALKAKNDTTAAEAIFRLFLISYSHHPNFILDVVPNRTAVRYYTVFQNCTRFSPKFHHKRDSLPTLRITHAERRASCFVIQSFVPARCCGSLSGFSPSRFHRSQNYESH